MSLTRHILTSSAQLTLANALARALGIVSLPLLTLWLSPSAYGQAALASTLISLVSVIGLMGMDMSYSRAYLSRDPPNGVAVETLLWRLALAAAVVAGTVAAAIWWVHAYGNAQAMASVAVLVFLGAAGSLCLAMAQTRSRLHQRHARLALAVAIGGVAATVVSLALARWVVADERALVVGYVTAYILPILIMGVPGWKQLREPSGLAPGMRRAAFMVGLPGVVTAPMYWILSSSDRWFLQASADSAAVGVYAVACTFGQLGMMVNSALLAMWLPEATRVHEATERVEGDRSLARLFTRLLVVMLLVWLGVAVLGSDLLRWLTDNRFHIGAELVPWLASAVFFYGVYHLANTGLFLGRKLKWSAVAWAMAGCVSLTANAMLIPRYGTMAAATVQCATFAALALPVWLLSQRVHPLPLPTRRIALGFAMTLLGVVAGSGLPAVVDAGTAGTKSVLLGVVCVAVLWALEPGLLGHARRGITGAGR
jgi:O-antigen/teichoic acid export membrane protein